MMLAGRTEKELETLNGKLTVELEEKRSLAAKLSDELRSTQTELDQLKSELAKVSIMKSDNIIQRNIV